MEGTSQLIAALSLHGLDLGVVECMKGQMLDFTVILKNKQTVKVKIMHMKCTNYLRKTLRMHYSLVTFLKKKWLARWLSTMGLLGSMV